MGFQLCSQLMCLYFCKYKILMIIMILIIDCSEYFIIQVSVLDRIFFFNVHVCNKLFSYVQQFCVITQILRLVDHDSHNFEVWHTEFKTYCVKKWYTIHIGFNSPFSSWKGLFLEADFHLGVCLSRTVLTSF